MAHSPMLMCGYEEHINMKLKYAIPCVLLWGMAAFGQQVIMQHPPIWVYQGGVPPASDLVLQYLMGANGSETSYTLDTSGNNRTGTVTDATWVAATNGLTDYYDFDGINDQITFTNDITLQTNEAFSVSAWIKKSGGAYPDWVLLKQNASTAGFNFGYSSDPNYADLFFGCGNGGWAKFDTGDIGLELNTWYNVLVTYNGEGHGVESNFNVYVDGVNKAISTTAALNTTPLVENAISPFVSDWFGNIWGLEIYDIEVSASNAIATNIQQRAELGTLSQYFADNPDDYDDLRVNATFNGNFQNGSQYAYIIAAPSPPVQQGSVSNGWGDFASSIISYADNDNLSFTNFTFNAWVNPDGVSGNGTIISKWTGGNEYIFWQSGANYQILINGSVGSTATNGASAGAWQLVTATYDAPTESLLIYVDGVLFDDSTIARATTTGTGAMSIGSLSGNYFNGQVSDISMLDVVWDVTKINDYESKSRITLGFTP